MLRIRDLHATVDGKEILTGVDLDVPPGEVHAVMGPNGAGKSTLANVLAGRDGYAVRGTVTLDGTDLLDLEPEARAVARSLSISRKLVAVRLKLLAPPRSRLIRPSPRREPPLLSWAVNWLTVIASVLSPALIDTLRNFSPVAKSSNWPFDRLA